MSLKVKIMTFCLIFMTLKVELYYFKSHIYNKCHCFTFKRQKWASIVVSAWRLSWKAISLYHWLQCDQSSLFVTFPGPCGCPVGGTGPVNVQVYNWISEKTLRSSNILTFLLFRNSVTKNKESRYYLIISLFLPSTKFSPLRWDMIKNKPQYFIYKLNVFFWLITPDHKKS